MNSSTSNSNSASSSSLKLPPTYYVNSRLLSSHINRTVRLIGKIVSVSNDGSRIQLESCDGGIVNVIRSMGSDPLNSKFICVTGTVQADSTIRESVSESFGDNFNLENFNKVIGFMEKSPRLFSVL